MVCSMIKVPAAAGWGQPALRRRDRCCAQAQFLRRARCPHRAANSVLASVPRRRGGHRPPTPAPQRADRHGLQQTRRCQHGRSMSAPTAETEIFAYFRKRIPTLRLFSPSVTASPCHLPRQRKVFKPVPHRKSSLWEGAGARNARLRERSPPQRISFIASKTHHTGGGGAVIRLPTPAECGGRWGPHGGGY